MDEPNESFEDYILRMVEKGYIATDGQPLKCSFCDSSKLENRNEYYEESYIIEYQVFCGTCDKQVGLWAYGNWQL